MLDAVNLPPQPDAQALAALLGLQLWPTNMLGARLDGDTLYYDENAPRPLQQRMAARCVARWALRWCELTETDEAIEYVARRLVSLRAVA